MFARMKQSIREKKGRAVATSLPPELVEDMKYTESWEIRDRKLMRAFERLTSSWESNKLRRELHQLAEELRIGGVSAGVQEGAGALGQYQAERVAKEKFGQTEGAETFQQQMKTFFDAELKELLDAAKNLKKERLNKDAAAADYGKNQNEEQKLKMQEADVEYKKALKTMQNLFARIPELEHRHATSLSQAIGAFAVSFQ